MTILSLTKNRRELVDALYAMTGVKMRYQGPPTFAYTDGIFTIDREGNLIVDDFNANVCELRELAAQKLIDDSWDEYRSILSIDIPIGQHTVQSLLQLLQMMWSKQELINKAVGASSGFMISHSFIEQLIGEPPTSVSEFLFLWEIAGKEVKSGIAFDEKKIHFIGFPYTEEPERIRAYMDLMTAICNEARIAKKVKCEKPEAENERYYFRVWLVRIGLTGEKYKSSRRVLLSKLVGNAAFRTREQALIHKEKYVRRRTDEVKKDRAGEVIAEEIPSLRLRKSING